MIMRRLQRRGRAEGRWSLTMTMNRTPCELLDPDASRNEDRAGHLEDPRGFGLIMFPFAGSAARVARVEGDKPKWSRFKAYSPGYFHSDLSS